MFADILGSAMKDFGKRHANECILIIDLHKLTGRIAASPEEYGGNSRDCVGQMNVVVGYDTERLRVCFDEIVPLDHGPLIRRTGRLSPYLEA